MCLRFTRFLRSTSTHRLQNSAKMVSVSYSLYAPVSSCKMYDTSNQRNREISPSQSNDDSDWLQTLNSFDMAPIYRWKHDIPTRVGRIRNVPYFIQRWFRENVFGNVSLIDWALPCTSMIIGLDIWPADSPGLIADAPPLRVSRCIGIVHLTFSHS